MKPARCVIVVENLPVPLDRHVWQQALSLREAGWDVSVICPATRLWPKRRERLEGIEIYRHGLPVEGNSVFGHVAEYATALFHEFRLLLTIWNTKGFDVVHVCNPPDLLFMLALPFKLRGVKLVFDHHDLAPELFEAIHGRGFIHKILLFLERMSFRSADVVLSSNQAFKRLALDRGGVREACTFVVRTVPEVKHVRRVTADRIARAGASVVVGYLGIIGRQDGLDHLLQAVRIALDKHEGPDFRLIIIGDGPALSEIKDLAEELGLSDAVVFRGYLMGDDLAAQMSDFDIGMIPDPKNSFNDKLSMNKVFEYSAMAIPIAAYALNGTVEMLGGTAVYAPTDDPEGLATAMRLLINDPELRRVQGAAAKKLADSTFRWDVEAASLLAAYESLPERHRT
jgi:glycosyltransferase involved in cell wall biosynthesis